MKEEKEDFFTNINKFMRGMIILSVIAFIGAIGSLILEYIAVNGFFDFLASIGAVIIYLLILIFLGLCIGFIINVLTYIVKKVY